METNILFIIIAVIAGGVAGVIVGKLITAPKANKLKEEAEKEAQKIMREAEKEGERLKKEKMLEAKEKYLQMKAEREDELNQRVKKVEDREMRIKKREQSLSQQVEQNSRDRSEVDNIKSNLNRQLEIVEMKKNELEKSHQEHVKKLENIAKLSADEAREELISSLKKEAETASMAQVKEIMDEAKLKANKEAKKVVIQTIQRTAAEHTIENTVSVFNLESDDIKGQIIGREGRNIRALEAATGVEIIVDDTPEAIIISGYDPVRREVARLSLQRLVQDGRIHPARIEEVVAKTIKQMEEQVVEIGERTVIDLGIHGLHPELVRIVGRMRFRSSYGQNLLQHSREVAHLSATMAAELGLNAKMAKRAGLLHDIGKVPEEESELSHALLGMKICEKYGEHPAICNAVGAHHDEVEMKYVLSPITQICDAISGARPGARRETMQNYLKRIKELETLPLSYDGVDKAFAIQAGRELRVIVESEKITDKQADELAFDISQKIQDEMTYPGQVKVTVIREKRAVAVAR
ncbi:MAG: ribonuclease Y [Chitinophagaceae bacterium]|nr:MAG: ribonuclease Y [Chitinophagaceae bacterium]